VDNWKALPNDRKLKKVKNYSVIVPSELPNVVPLDCPVCIQLMRDHDDVLSYGRNECCGDCEITWAIPRNKDWRCGWRPDPKTITSEINKRNNYPSFIYQVK